MKREGRFEKEESVRRTLGVWIVALPFLVLGIQGCAALLIGTAGVIGGVAISEDTVQSEIDAGYDQVWNVTLNEIEKMAGKVTLKDKVTGLMEAKVRASNVHIQIDRITEKTVRLKVKARKNYLPNIKLAHEISARILRK